MTTYRFAARSTTPGKWRFSSGALAQLIALSDIRYNVGRGDGQAGTCHVPTAAQTLYGVPVDVSATGNITLPNTDGSTPDASLVKNTAHFGVGNATQGTFDASVYTLISGVVAAGDVRNGTARYSGGPNGTWDAVSKSDVVSASFVVTGNSNYVGGSAGSYPTTASTQAAQLAADQASVLASAGWIISGHSILSQAGTFDLTADRAAQYSSGLADQLVSDQSAVAGSTAWIVTGHSILSQAGSYPTTETSQASQLQTDKDAVTAKAAYLDSTKSILGISGTLNMSLYTLIANVVDPQYVLYPHYSYVGGPQGSAPGGVDFPTAAEIRAEIDANSSELAAIRSVTNQLSSMYEVSGGQYRWVAEALSQVPPTDVSADLATWGKTGFKLAADGLDEISAATPSGVATTFAQKLMQVWSRFFGRSRVDRNARTLKTYRSDGSTVATTQTYVSGSSVDDIGDAQ